MAPLYLYPLVVFLTPPNIFLSRFLLPPDVTFPFPCGGAAAVSARRSGRRRRRAAPYLHRHRPDDGRVAGVRPLPPWRLPARTLHVDAEEPVRAVPLGLLHGAMELHRQVPPLRRVRPEPGGEEGVHRGQQLPVRVRTGILLQEGVRHVRRPQRVSGRTRSAEQR